MENTSLSVASFHKKDGITSHITYSIKGYDHQGDIDSTRRYKDFTCLRKILTSNWPGCFIPQIPPKQMIGNLDNNFVERRRKLLDKFIKSISLQHHLYTSEEFQKFLRDPGEYFKLDFKVLSYINIAEIYHKVFNEYSVPSVDLELTKTLQNYLDFCSTALPAFERFEKLCKKNADNFERFESSSENLMTAFVSVNKLGPELYTTENNDLLKKAPMENSFLLLLDWSRGEILDMKAMIEAVQKHLSFAEKMKEFQKTLEIKQRKADEAKQGKKTISDLFSKKDKDVKKKEYKNAIEFIELEISGIQTIESINQERLIQHDLPMFKDIKVKNLATVLKLFADSMTEELNKHRAQISSMIYSY